MQHQQQGGGGGGGGVERIVGDEDQKSGDLGIAEAASPISSRPPIGNCNFEEMIRETAAEGGGSSSNRWPRQETLALLQIRSEMDTAFRDATLKGPLWDQVSRKMGDMGFKRSAKKCKEKFENVQKYYKRTKEGRGGRQDGKSYKFFTQLEALHHTTTTTAAVTAAVSLPQPVMPQQDATAVSLPPHTDYGATLFDDDFSSSDSSEEEKDEDKSADNRRGRKRKRSRGGGEEGMMELFEGLLKQVMQKQEAMQQKFLETIEKREKDRMIREEAWKRQDLARIARENDLMAKERAASAARDAAVIDFLQKITGQTIHLPTTTTTTIQPQPQPQTTPPPPPPPPPPTTTVASPEPPQESAPPSRWPKPEVLALIKLRSGMESRYQEVGPKGSLWEEISAAMQQMGYNRNAKRCKEKWENINKYFKKVKESNKKRPQDAKTCPYFDELDALYRKKVTSGGGSSEMKEDGGGEGQAGGSGGDSRSNVGEEKMKQPEDLLNKGHQRSFVDAMANYYSNVNCSNSDQEYEEVDDKTEEEIEMVYKSSSFIAMVQ